MDYNKIKKQANDILKTQAAECSYIEYKASSNQHNKILKTLCAYGNNYYDNDVQFLFIGVEEISNESDKSVPNYRSKALMKVLWKNVRTKSTRCGRFCIQMFLLN